MHTVYVITNQVNDKMYVGQTSAGLSSRWSGHRKDAKHGAGQPLYRAMRKYGIEAFRCDPLVQVETKEEAEYQERAWILLLGAHVSKNGYVCTWGGDGRIGPCPETRWKRINSLRQTLAKDPSRHSRYRTDINTEEIVRLYVDERWTRREISEKFHCTPQLIDQRMKKLGVRVGRGRKGINQQVPEKCYQHFKQGKTGKDNPTFRTELLTEDMVSLYTSGMTLKQVGAELGCSAYCVKYRLITHAGIKLRPSNNVPRK